MTRSAPDIRWSTPAEATLLICRGATFNPAARISLIVGTLLTLVNQATVLASGELGPATWARVVANYAIPYVVSSIGFLSAHRVRPGKEE